MGREDMERLIQNPNLPSYLSVASSVALPIRSLRSRSASDDGLTSVISVSSNRSEQLEPSTEEESSSPQRIPSERLHDSPGVPRGAAGSFFRPSRAQPVDIGEFHIVTTRTDLRGSFASAIADES